MGMTQAEQDMMNMVAHSLIERVDAMGQGRELMEHLGKDGTKEMMDMYRAHEKKSR